MAEDDTADTGEEQDTTPDEGGTQDTTPRARGGSEQQGETYSRDELERIVKKRLERERAKYSDYDQLKQAAKERETAAQTLEQQVEALRREQAERDAAAVAEKAELAGERLHAKLVRGGLSDDDASTLLGTIDTLRLLDEGKPNGREIDRLAKALLKIGTRPAPDPDQGRKGGTAAPSMNQMIREAANRTRVG